MNQECWDQIDDYFTGKLIPSDPSLDAVLLESAKADLPAINVTPLQGRFLNMLVAISGSKHILEIGTLGGYSTIWMARALPENGSVVTLELNPHCAEIARANFRNTGVSERIDLREGPALDALPLLLAEDRAPFDFVFLDANKEQHPDYFEWALKLGKRGTLIIADNVVRGGGILDANPEDPNLRGIRKLVDMIQSDPRVEATALQTVGSKGYDGFAIARII